MKSIEKNIKMLPDMPVAPYQVYIPYTYAENNKSFDIELEVIVSNDISEGILEFQDYEIIRIKIDGDIFAIHDDKFTIEPKNILDSNKLIQEAYVELEKLENNFLV